MATTYSVLLRRLSSTQQNNFHANIGAFLGLQAVIVVSVDGSPVSEVPPTAVAWQFNGPSEAVGRYHPTTAAGVPIPVDLQANPVDLFYWFPQTPGGTSTVSIVCDAQAPDGTWVRGSGSISLLANLFQLAGGVQGTIQLQALPNRNTLLSYGDSLGPGMPGFALAYNTGPGANYAGWLGSIQLVNGVRQFTGASGTVYTLTDTEDQFVLDGRATDPDFIYGKIEVEDGEIAEYTFDDSPNQELLPVINDDPITRFDVNETFQLYMVFNGSTSQTPSNDPAQIWFSIAACVNWGWQASVANNGHNQWQITAQQVIGPTPGAFQLPSWQGTIQTAFAQRPDPLRSRRRRLVKNVKHKGKPKAKAKQ